MNGKKKNKIPKILLGSPEMGLPIQRFQSQDMVMGNPERVEQSNRHFRNLVEKAPFPICILKGEDMVIEVANDSVFKIWHVGNEALGKPFLEIVPEMKGQPFMGYLLDVLKNGITHYGYEEPAYFIRENGVIENAYFNFVYQPYFEADGSISGVMVSAFDVTMQVVANNKTKESESYFRLMAKFLPDKITKVQPDGTIIYYNKSWQDYTGASFDELMNEGGQKWIHPDEVEETTQRWLQSLETGNDFDMVLRMLNHQGEYRWHTSRARAVKDENGKTKLWIGFNSDIHNQKNSKRRAGTSGSQ